MTYAGIDIGSRSIELVIIDENGQIAECLKTDTGFNPVAQAQTLIKGRTFEKIMATGYGRGLFEMAFDHAQTVTEIKAHARGVVHEFEDAASILDIGGQDSKAIALNAKGRVIKFEMNDRCAAGTGKFLEIMAKNLGFSLDQFGVAALAANQDLSINSMCTVFAESEVTSLIAQGADRQEIARGLHLSVVKRAAAMIGRVSSQGPIVFSGGVAKNPCIRDLVAEKMNRQVLVPKDPQMMGAMGAALLLLDRG
ncbi:MAG: 3-hydroxyacyl-ACP dehydratase [Desulfobacter sp.]|nr:3-hydroxyacyl-ACP dehydratase [Desulfobacter sp.]WDP85247.1 MAG: 3-hydroxyacyl-ACP dehydratase [Desulfobacter sp.]